MRLVEFLLGRSGLNAAFSRESPTLLWFAVDHVGCPTIEFPLCCPHWQGGSGFPLDMRLMHVSHTGPFPECESFGRILLGSEVGE